MESIIAAVQMNYGGWELLDGWSQNVGLVGPRLVDYGLSSVRTIQLDTVVNLLGSRPAKFYCNPQ